MPVQTSRSFILLLAFFLSYSARSTEGTTGVHALQSGAISRPEISSETPSQNRDTARQWAASERLRANKDWEHGDDFDCFETLSCGEAGLASRNRSDHAYWINKLADQEEAKGHILGYEGLGHHSGVGSSAEKCAESLVRNQILRSAYTRLFASALSTTVRRSVLGRAFGSEARTATVLFATPEGTRFEATLKMRLSNQRQGVYGCNVKDIVVKRISDGKIFVSHLSRRGAFGDEEHFTISHR